MRFIISGTTGFIGAALTQAALDSGAVVLGINRYNNEGHIGSKKYKSITYGDLKNFPLKKYDTFVNCAGAAHKNYGKAFDAQAFDVNSFMVDQLYNVASSAEVKRFINISSASVYSCSSKSGFIHEGSPKVPATSYGMSKLVGENLLMKSAIINGNTQVISLRPPIVYGLDAPGNVANLIKLCKIGIPIPIKGCSGLRSIIHINNLVNFVIFLSTINFKGVNFLNVADFEPVNLGKFVQMLDKLNNSKTNTFTLPQNLIKRVCELTGKSGIYEKLYDDFLLDTKLLRDNFDWVPKSIDEFK